MIGRLKIFARTHAHICILEAMAKDDQDESARMTDNNRRRTAHGARFLGAAGLAAGRRGAGSGALGAPQNAAIRQPAAERAGLDAARSATASPCAPYGTPSKFEKHVIRRDVEWLTASRESSVSFTPLHALDGIITPNGLCFERHHAGIAEVDPADYRLMLHGLVDKPLMFTLDDIKRMPRVNRAYFLRMRGELRHGVARRAAQRLPVHPRHGALRDVHRRAAEDAAAGSGREAQREVAAAGRRRRRRDDALAADRKRRSTMCSSPIA